MFNLFKKKSPTEALYKKHDAVLAQAHKLSTTDRTASDAKMAEAEAILNEIKALEKEA